MTLTEARALVRQFSRNGLDSTMFSDADVDRAIMVVGARFCRTTRCIHIVEELTLEQGESEVDVSTLPDNFRPEQVRKAFVEDVEEPLQLVTWETLYRNLVEDDSEGTPTMLAWEDDETPHVWPVPDEDAETLLLHRWQPFTQFTAGHASPDNVTLDIPDDDLIEILTFGVPATLNHTSPEHGYASASWARYLDYERKRLGGGNMGARVLTRVLPAR